MTSHRNHLSRSDEKLEG